MSFIESELKSVAEFYGVDIEDEWSVDEIEAELDDNGVTVEMWDQTKAEAEAAAAKEAGKPAPAKRGRPAKKAPQEKAQTLVGGVVLVKMTRLNPTYEVNGHRFTKDHPYVAMSAEEAQEIFDLEEGVGFTLANPREVQEYYS